LGGGASGRKNGGCCGGEIPTGRVGRRFRLANHKVNQGKGEKQGTNHDGEPGYLSGCSAVALQGFQERPIGLRRGDNATPSAIEAPICLPVKTLHSALDNASRPASFYVWRLAARAYNLHRVLSQALFVLLSALPITFSSSGKEKGFEM